LPDGGWTARRHPHRRPDLCRSRGARRDVRLAPKIGQHSIEILREIGYGKEEIEAMMASQVTLDGRIAAG